ncbi:unnamed protein product [Lampetra fluviatilis]
MYTQRCSSVYMQGKLLVQHLHGDCPKFLFFCSSHNASPTHLSLASSSAPRMQEQQQQQEKAEEKQERERWRGKKGKAIEYAGCPVGGRAGGAG